MQNLCRDTLVWRDVPFRVFSSCRASNSFLGSDEAAAREPRRPVPSRASFEQREYGPSIGVLLCRTKDYEVAEYAMNRHLSPALVTQYETQMIPKAIPRQKLHEWSQLLHK
jgi:hypothetical protein